MREIESVLVRGLVIEDVGWGSGHGRSPPVFLFYTRIWKKPDMSPRKSDHRDPRPRNRSD